MRKALPTVDLTESAVAFLGRPGLFGSKRARRLVPEIEFRIAMKSHCLNKPMNSEELECLVRSELLTRYKLAGRIYYDLLEGEAAMKVVHEWLRVGRHHDAPCPLSPHREKDRRTVERPVDALVFKIS